MIPFVSRTARRFVRVLAIVLSVVLVGAFACGKSSQDIPGMIGA